MRLIVTAYLLLIMQTPAGMLPPAYPRPGATKILDNPRVQVWNIAWLKGVSYPMHRHLYDLAGIYYSPGDRTIIAADGSKRPVSTKAGDIAFQRRGVTHTEEGASDPPLRAVFVELKEDAPSGRVAKAEEGAPPLGGIGVKKLLDNDRVTVWAYSYGFGMDGPRHRHDVDAVVVWITDGTPHVAWVPAGTIHAEEDLGVISEATIFELK